ncbi:LysR substrate-binding domain-containing protein [Rhizobium sp. 1AS11]|uniref:LysR family transcriptional regulator n=1 Tax=Rhizobium acaciae TaxID=2989736 RepID=UPI002221BCC8|nr:LysR substrate-binding domain-containing protein [Rhizobium acaciae]MCW1413410.1 LysR substrate-binding domain-containing protein [Rhizobium acaciae]MCW1745560.1 LysR substrate-binding domain-containing protein [Rhizobium acaciae]
MLQNIETSLLRTFVTIANTGSFTRSAQILFRTQSAITMQMQKLEEILGCRLTYRSGKSLSLTDEGDALLPYAVEILRLNDELQSDLRSMKRREEIRVGTSDDYAVILLPEILNEFSAAHPNVTMTVNCSNRDQNLEKLKKGEIDILLTPVMADEQMGETLRTERLVWVGSSETEITDSEPVPLTGFPLGCVCRDVMIRSLNQNNREWKFVYSSNSIVSIHSAILSGRVVSALEESTVPHGGSIIDGRFGLPSLPHVKISVLRNKDRQNRIHDRFYEHMRESLKHQAHSPKGREGGGYSSAPLPQIAGLAAAHIPPIA